MNVFFLFAILLSIGFIRHLLVVIKTPVNAVRFADLSHNYILTPINIKK